MACWTLFKVFFWKNLLFVRFNWLSLTLIFTACASILGVYLYSTFQLLTTPKHIYDFRNINILKQHFPLNDYLFYAPQTPKIDVLMENVRLELQLSGETLKSFPNATEMRSSLEQNCRGNCFAVHFQVPEDLEQNHGSLHYAISSAAIRVSPRKRYINDEGISGIKDDDDYIRTGFLLLQHVIDKNFIQLRSNDESYEFDVEISSMPSIAQEAMDGQRLILFGLIYSILFCVLLLSTFVVPLVEEKQDGLKEFLIVATPLNFLNGITFFLVRLALYLLFMIVVLLVASYYSALGIIPVGYIFILFVLYTLSAMIYSYLITVCFSSDFYAKIGGLLLLALPYIFYLHKGGIFTVASFFFSTKAFMDGLEVFQIFTNKYRDFSYEDLTVKITDFTSTMLTIYGYLILQCILYALLYNYLSCVFPGPGGLKKPFTFIFRPSFYKKKQRNQYTTNERGADAIIVQDLAKRFKTPARQIVIADRLNMVIKNKQITVLLGHNGVGKTTTLNMIMGSEPKDAGKIIVCSERDVASYRHLIGFCPQHSVFMHYMTCKQHLQFFAMLRGMTAKESLLISNSLLEQLRLEHKANEYGKNLSGGMKRRLSLGIAISGDTKVVVLDEPSSGLDIESRRELWDILLKLRKTKAVLVTTHYMEEAEVLGDTICILANGRLQRTGSPLELKRKIGSGYILKLCTNNAAYKEQQTLELIQQRIPDAKVLNIVPPTVLISLPYEWKSKYSSMLKELEDNQMYLGINSISITDTSLEDVFLNSAADADQVDSRTANYDIDDSRVPYQNLDQTSNITWRTQMGAIYYKKFTFLRSEWKYTLFMVLLPFLSIAMAIMLMSTVSTASNDDVLLLNLKHVKEGIIFVHHPTKTAYTNDIDELLTKQIEAYDIKVEHLDLGENSVIEGLIRLQNDNLANFLQNVVGVIEIVPSNDGGTKFVLYFSGNIYHSSVILLNLIDNAVLKQATGKDNSISTTYVPIRRFLTDVSPVRLEYYAVIVPIGLFFYLFYYVSLPFKEHQTGFKYLQAVPRLVYWTSTISFDFLLHCIVCVLLFAFQIAIMPDQLYSVQEQVLIIVSIIFYGLCYLPILYGFANSCRSISTISTYLLCMLIISAIAPLITSGNIPAMKYHETKILILCLLPDFNLNHQLRIVNERFSINRRSVMIYDEVLSSNRYFFYALSIFTVAWIVFINVLENKDKLQALQNIFNCYNCRQVVAKAPVDAEEEEEGLVHEEKSTVEHILKEKSQSNYPLLVSKLYKFYNRNAAVCDLNFAVKKQECFGLLGVNGAGKTSTFQMVAANIPITGGTIKIDGIDILENETQYRYRFGYCPQHDCLNNFMTAYEMLKYMAILRGVSKPYIHNEVMFWMEKLNLEKYQHIAIRHYSGGTKRKLNTAVAMIGSPSLVLLDEPTTGVDPISRRFLWKCIQDFQKRNKTVVLTSHSMDECEQLCNRLAIMADGRFKCLGFVPDLKVRFGSGFTIKMKMKEIDCEENVDTITQEICLEFIDCELRENHAGMLTYFIRNANQIAWSDVFHRTERFMEKNSNLIEEYSVSESTLEDIFLKFDMRSQRCHPNSHMNV